MEPVQKNEFLLAQNYENGVAQLKYLGERKQPHPVLRGWIGASHANRMVQSFHVERIVHLLNHVITAGHAENGQSDVPQGETFAKFEWFACAHELLNGVDYEHVDDGHVRGVVPILLHPLEAGVQFPVQYGE